MGRIISFAAPSYYSASRASSPEPEKAAPLPPSMTIGKLTFCTPTGATYDPTATATLTHDAFETKLCTPGIGTRYHSRQSSITPAGGRRRRLSRPVKTVTWSTAEPRVLLIDYDYNRTPWVPANPSAETMRRWAAGVGLEDDEDADEDDDTTFDGDEDEDDASSEELTSGSDDGSLDDLDSLSSEAGEDVAARDTAGTGSITPPPGLVEDDGVSSQEATADEATPRDDHFIANAKQALHLVCDTTTDDDDVQFPSRDRYDEVSPTSTSPIRPIDRLPSIATASPRLSSAIAADDENALSPTSSARSPKSSAVMSMASDEQLSPSSTPAAVAIPDPLAGASTSTIGGGEPAKVKKSRKRKSKSKSSSTKKAASIERAKRWARRLSQ